MGYALKLQSVNFSSVAVDQVTFQDRIPCTAISLSPSSLSFDTAEETGQLTASLTPNNTTDELLWTSSNENIATVSNDGLVTIHGIGTAIITATCGEQTATVSINQTMLKSQYPYASLSGYYAGGDTVTGGKILGRHSASNQAYAGSAYHDTDDLRIKEATGTIECIRVPYGASYVNVNATGDAKPNYIEVVDTTSSITVDGKKYPEWIKNKDFPFSSGAYAVEYGQAFAFRGNTANIEAVNYVYFE